MSVVFEVRKFILGGVPRINGMVFDVILKSIISEIDLSINSLECITFVVFRLWLSLRVGTKIILILHAEFHPKIALQFDEIILKTRLVFLSSKEIKKNLNMKIAGIEFTLKS